MANPMIADDGRLDLNHATKKNQRENASARAWAMEQVKQRDQAQAPKAGEGDGAQPRDDVYEAAKANFEAARSDIEAGKLPHAYPNWAAAETALEQIRTRNQPPKPDDEQWWQKAVRNLSPLEAAGGALDYADNAFETIRQISAKGDEALMGMGVPALTVGPDGVGTTTNYDEFAKTKNVGDALPDIGDPQKMGLARSVGRFMAGFATAGRMLSGVQTLRTVAESGRMGASAVAALKGAMSDFAGVREMEGSVANLIQEFPALQNPVTDFLSAKEESPEIVNKLKTAIAGAGFGMAVDGIFAGLRAVRAGRQIKGGLQDADQLVAGLVNEAETQRGMITEVLGNPDDTRLLLDAGEEAAQQGAEAGAKGASAGARTAADGATNPRMNPGGKPGEVFVNWARIDTEDDVKNVIQELANRFSGSIDEARGGVKSFADTEAEAATENAWKLLNERSKGQPLNASQTLAVRKLWTSSGEKVSKLAQRVGAGGGVADQIALKKMIAVHATIQEQVIGIRTETARALAQWRIPAGESDQFLSGMQQLMQQMGTDRDVVAIAKGINRLKAMGNESGADAFILGASKIDDLKAAGLHAADITRQLFYLSLLSGPKTHARNFLSNSAMLIANAIDRKGASMLGEALGGQNVPDGESGSLLYGTLKGLRDAFTISDAARAAAEADGVAAHSPFVNALLTGQQGMGVGKLEEPMTGALEAAKFGMDPESNLGRVMDWVDTATRIPTHGLAASDEVFRTANFQAQIHALAFRRAWTEAESGAIAREAIQSRADELARTPDLALKMLAQDYAEKSTFSNAPPWDSKTWQAIRGIGRFPVLGKLAMAFTKTPYNIFVETAQRTPLAFATSRFRQEIAAGGARADIAWSKFLVGNAALIALADLAVNSHFTGDQKGLGQGDKSTGELANRRAMGEQPMSLIQRNDDGSVRTFGYRGLEPFSTLIGMASNVVEILGSDQFDADDKEVDDVVRAAAAAIANQVSNPSFMTGLSQLTALQSDPLMGSERYAEHLAGTLVPNAIAEAARWNDPVIREVNGELEAIMARTPGLSKTLPPSTDRWGHDITRASGFGKVYDAFVPFESRITKPGPIDREFDRLERGLARPPKKQFFDGVSLNMKLHPKEYTRFVKLQGDEITSTVDGDPITAMKGAYESEGGTLFQELNSIVEGTHSFSETYWDPEATDGPDGSRADMLMAIVHAYHDAAKWHLLEEFPDLRAKLAIRHQKMYEAGLVGENNKFLDNGG